MKIKQKFALVALCIVLTLLISACGGTATPPPEDSGAATEVAQPPTDQPESTAGEDVVVLEENIVIVAHPFTFPDLDPRSSYGAEIQALANVYETLTIYNPPGVEERLGPKLATSWETNEEATDWTFHLREGVKFQDGTDFNAEAVKFSIDRITDLGMGGAFIYDAIEQIVIVDNLTIQFKLSYAAPLDLIFSSGWGAWMMSPSSTADKDSEWFAEGNGVGTGPYVFESYEPGQRLVLTRFEDYWGGWEEGQFTTVVFEIAEEATSREQMLRSGSADFTRNLPFENLEALDALDGVAVYNTPAFQNMMMVFNVHKPPVDDPAVRLALSYTVPQNNIVQAAFGGYATPATDLIPASMWGHDPNIPGPILDLEKAAELLSDAGYPGGGIELDYWYSSGSATGQKVGELWKAELSKIGVDLSLHPVDYSVMVDAVEQGDPATAWHVYPFVWVPTYATPYDFLFSPFHTNGARLMTFQSYPEFDALIDKGNELTATDIPAASLKFSEAQLWLLDRSIAIPVADYPEITIIRDDVLGYVDNPAYPYTVFWHETRR